MSDKLSGRALTSAEYAARLEGLDYFRDHTDEEDRSLALEYRSTGYRPRDVPSLRRTLGELVAEKDDWVPPPNYDPLFADSLAARGDADLVAIGDHISRSRMYFGTDDFCTIVRSMPTDPITDFNILMNGSSATVGIFIALQDSVYGVTAAHIRLTGGPGSDSLRDGWGVPANGRYGLEGCFWTGSVNDSHLVLTVFRAYLKNFDEHTQTARIIWACPDGGIIDSTSGPFEIIPKVLSILPQSALFALSPHEYSKKAVKIARKQRRVLPEITVINLRHASVQRELRATTEAYRTYQGRWVVRGHWRSQPCGPGGQRRKRIYITPYVKGPTDKPLIHRERVYQW